MEDPMRRGKSHTRRLERILVRDRDLQAETRCLEGASLGTS
jgi:hypothetical protein